MKLNPAVEQLKPSPTLALNQKAKALIASGKSVVNLTTGEPDFVTPKRICEAAKKAMEQGHTKYTPTSGIPELKRAILEYIFKEYGRTYSLQSVIVTSGAKQALFNLCFSLLNPGDEVIVFSPYWVSYTDMVELMQAKAIILSTQEENRFIPEFTQLENAINNKTRFLFLNSPSNPTGAVYPKDSLRKIADLIKKWPNVLVVTDDIYGKLVFDGFSFTSIAMFQDFPFNQLVIINGMSKSYSMTGWRIGYALGPEPLISAMDAVQSQSISCATSIAQWAALEAITGDQSDVIEMRDTFEKRRDFLYNKIGSIPDLTCFKPQGAFYIFPNVNSFLGKNTPRKQRIETDSELASYLLEEYGLASVPGCAFGSPGYLRLSFATSMNELEEGVERLKKGLSALQ